MFDLMQSTFSETRELMKSRSETSDKRVLQEREPGAEFFGILHRAGSRWLRPLSELRAYSIRAAYLRASYTGRGMLRRSREIRAGGTAPRGYFETHNSVFKTLSQPNNSVRKNDLIRIFSTS